MPPVDPRAVLSSVAARVAAQVATYADRVAVDRAPQGEGAWDLLADGPYAVVLQTGPASPVLRGDGKTHTESLRVAVAVWQHGTDVSTVVADTIVALEGWRPDTGLRPLPIGAYRIPQADTDVLRTEVEVRYHHQR